MPPQEQDSAPTSDPTGPPRRRILWWNRLGVKASAVITLVTAAGLTVFVALNLRAQRDYLTAEVLRGAAQFSDTIKASTYHFMLADDRANAYRSMETIGRLKGIERVRMLNKEGLVTFSTDRSEIGLLVDKSGEACYACHAAGQPLVRLNVPSRSRLYQRDGHRVLGLITPIYNEPSCSTAVCHEHPPAKQVLGVVDIAMSLEDEDHAGLAVFVTPDGGGDLPAGDEAHRLDHTTVASARTRPRLHSIREPHVGLDRACEEVPVVGCFPHVEFLRVSMGCKQSTIRPDQVDLHMFAGCIRSG